MRQITVKYQGVCAKCDKPLEVGGLASYEKTTGIFCVGCEPTEVEDIRHYRTIKAQKRADRLLGKATRLEAQAEDKQALFNRFRGDIAFVSQPGAFPLRTRALKSYDKGLELQREAEEARNKAENVMLYKTRVKGDAARRDEQKRAEFDNAASIGQTVYSYLLCGAREAYTIVKINKKTCTIRGEDGHTFPMDKIFLRFAPCTA